MHEVSTAGAPINIHHLFMEPSNAQAILITNVLLLQLTFT